MIIELTLAFLLSTLPAHGSLLLPWVDEPTGGLLWDPWLSERMLDPFRILEQTPVSSLLKDDDWRVPARVDWKETKDAHVITMDVPGLKKEEMKVEVDEESRVLRVIGESKREEEKKEDDHWHRSERSYGKFWRQFRLPENANLESVKAKLENGVLSIELGKLSPENVKGPRMVSIESGGDAKKAVTGEKSDEL